MPSVSSLTTISLLLRVKKKILFFNSGLFGEIQYIHYILQVKAFRKVLQIVNISGLFGSAHMIS